MTQPEAGPIIRGSGGLRKLRWRAAGRGKRGGVRVIYCIHGGHAFWMLTLYGKGEVEAIPGAVLKKIKEAMTHGQA